MKKKVVLFLSIFLVASCLLAMTACGLSRGEQGENALSFSVAYADGYDSTTAPFSTAYSGRDNEMIIQSTATLLRSRAELIALCGEKGYPFFDETDKNFYRSLGCKVRSYGSDYFEDKALLFLVLNETGYPRLGIDGLSVEKNVLTVRISRLDGELCDVETTYVFLAETESAGLKNVTQVKTESVNKGSVGVTPGRNADFFSLDYAYSAGLLDNDQVRSIGYYHNGGKEYAGEETDENKRWEDFVETDYSPLGKEPGTLTTDVIEEIKTHYAEMIDSALRYAQEKQGVVIKRELVRKSDVDFCGYYGTYRGRIAVSLRVSSFATQIVSTVIIAGTTFYYADGGTAILLYEPGR